MEPRRIQDRADLDRAVATAGFLLFKHSFRCSISSRAFAAYRAFVATHPNAATAYLDVVAQRDLAQAVAESSGIPHESPQALVFHDGRVVWHASHGDISAATLAKAVTAE